VVAALKPRQEAGEMTCSERRAETFIGLDVHKKQIVAAMLLQDGEVKETRQPHTAQGITRLVRWMRKESQGGFECCYEAGFCGYDLCRQLTGHGVLCRVVAPSQTPHAPGDRVKTDRRDARKLAWYLRAGMLSEVRLPTEEQEALRGLCRCRDDARRALHTARQQLVSFLDQRGLFYPQGPHWTTRHWSWAKSLRFENAIAQMTYEQYLSHVELEEARLREIDAQLREVAESEPYREPVGYLCCFRGIQWLTAILLLGELYDMGRFESPRTLMAYLGLTPSEQSSGEREHRGGITKTGNSLVRRLLVEVAWQYTHGARKGKQLSERQQGQPAWVVSQADTALIRLTSRYWRFIHRGKKPCVAATAVARELVGYIWAVLSHDADRTALAA